MLSQRKKNIIKLFLLFVLLTTSLVVFNPLALYMERILTEKKEELVAFLGEKTGIGFDYEAISPSILKHIVIKKITLFDYETKEQIGEAERIQVEYNFWNLIRGDFADVVKYIKVIDAHVGLDTEKNANIIEKLFKKKKDDESFDFENFKQLFSELKPCKAQVENCSFKLKGKEKGGKWQF